MVVAKEKLRTIFFLRILKHKNYIFAQYIYIYIEI